MKKKYLPALVMMGIIFIFSSCNADLSAIQSQMVVNYLKEFIPVNSFLVRKLAHFSLFFVLGFTIYLLTKNYKRTFIITSLYAIGDEVHQYFVPGRSCELRDVVIDVGGCVTVLIIIKLWRYLNDKRTKNNAKNGR